MNLWKTIFRLSGWKIQQDVNLPAKCVICVAPHTSNWDFLLGLASYRSLGRKANFLIKKFWFFFPMKYLMKYLGGIPVDRGVGRRGSLTTQVVELFRRSDYLNLAVTPEGTRSATTEWKTGFLVIAHEARVPIILAALDFSTKTIKFMKQYEPSSDIATDLKRIKGFYADKAHFARYPDKFSI